MASHVVHRTEVDGVPTFWSAIPGPFHGRLMFRVGRADERLPFAGVTHVVEHLALSGEFPEDLGVNGHVELTFTHLHATGKKSDVAAFLKLVTHALSDLPLDRLEAELRVLRTEEESRRPALMESLYALRYGPRGPGLVGFGEFGLRNLDERRVDDWAAEWFTRENAVLVLSGTPPKNLRLDLPSGSRRPWTNVAPVDQPLPTFLHQNSNLLAVSFLADRDAPTMLIPSLLENRLKARLRKAMGVSYAASAFSEPVDRDIRHVSVAVDVHPEHLDAAAEAFVEVVEELAERGPTADELRTLRRNFADAFRPKQAAYALLDWAARDELSGRRRQTLDAVVADLEKLTPAAVRKRLSLSLDSSIWSLPAGARAPEWQVEPLMQWSRDAVAGKKFRPRPDPSKRQSFTLTTPSKERLVVGEEGVMLQQTSNQRVTVRFDRCAAMLAWDNGDRVLHDETGFSLAVVPSKWYGGKRAVHAIDATVADEKIVRMGAAPATSKPYRIATWLMWILVPLAWLLFLSGFALVFDPTEEGDFAFGITLLCTCGPLAAYGTWNLSRRIRARRQANAAPAAT
jgi:predicted Zn-dependent peptidase